MKKKDGCSTDFQRGFGRVWRSGVGGRVWRSLYGRDEWCKIGTRDARSGTVKGEHGCAPWSEHGCAPWSETSHSNSCLLYTSPSPRDRG
eukprot:1083097-Rhodomonas_salina.1